MSYCNRLVLDCCISALCGFCLDLFGLARIEVCLTIQMWMLLLVMLVDYSL